VDALVPLYQPEPVKYHIIDWSRTDPAMVPPLVQGPCLAGPVLDQTGPAKVSVLVREPSQDQSFDRSTEESDN
jgi:hypothetical protein